MSLISCFTVYSINNTVTTTIRLDSVHLMILEDAILSTNRTWLKEAKIQVLIDNLEDVVMKNERREQACLKAGKP